MRRILFIVGLLTTLVTAGAIGFRVLSGEPWIDCFYMAVITITTVGFREAVELDAVGRLFVMAYLFCGLGVFTYAATQIGEWMMNARVRSLLESRRMQRRIQDYRGHFIVCGAGRMGKTIAAYLDERGKPFVVVDHDEDVVADVCHEKNWAYVIGDASHDETLERAGIDRAASLATVLATDADNLYVTLSARLLNSELMIVARAGDDEALQKLERAGANRVISPFSSGALKMARFMLSPSIEDFLAVADDRGNDLELADFSIADDSPLVGKSLQETRWGDRGVMVIGIRRANGQRLMPPDGSVRFEPGDCLFAFGNALAVNSVLDENEPGK